MATPHLNVDGAWFSLDSQTLKVAVHGEDSVRYFACSSLKDALDMVADMSLEHQQFGSIETAGASCVYMFALGAIEAVGYCGRVLGVKTGALKVFHQDERDRLATELDFYRKATPTAAYWHDEQARRRADQAYTIFQFYDTTRCWQNTAMARRARDGLLREWKMAFWGTPGPRMTYVEMLEVDVRLRKPYGWTKSILRGDFVFNYFIP
jgi:hypothetical protein